ncbi:MAG: hypothetical protein WAT23_05245, partial [Chromatiaceae bacterium]
MDPDCLQSMYDRAPLCIHAIGADGCLVGITRDRSQREQAEQDLRRLSRTHAVLSRCNRSLARAVDERSLLDAFCTNLVEVGRYGFAWVGYAGRRDARIRLAAYTEQGDLG